MRAMTKWTILASVALGAGACGGGGPSLDDFLGMHQVASHRENHGGGQYVPCDNPGDEIPEQSAAYRPYFAIVDEPAVEDENFVKFQTCTGSDAGSCVDTQIIMEYGDGQRDHRGGRLGPRRRSHLGRARRHRRLHRRRGGRAARHRRVPRRHLLAQHARGVAPSYGATAIGTIVQATPPAASRTTTARWPVVRGGSSSGERVAVGRVKPSSSPTEENQR
jgi:hypothetical protein